MYRYTYRSDTQTLRIYFLIYNKCDYNPDVGIISPTFTATVKSQTVKLSQ